MKRGTVLWSSFFLFFICLLSFGRADPVSIEMTEDIWTWQAGESATFSGTITGDDELLSSCTLHLSVLAGSSEPETGSVVFTTVNDHKIKVRKQSDTYEMPGDSLEEGIHFTGIWRLPETAVSHRTAIQLQVTASDGTSLGSASLSPDQDSPEANGGRRLFRIPIDLDQAQMILWISAGTVWCAVGLRFLLIHRKRTVNHAKSKAIEENSK